MKCCPLMWYCIYMTMVELCTLSSNENNEKIFDERSVERLIKIFVQIICDDLGVMGAILSIVILAILVVALKISLKDSPKVSCSKI